MLVRPVRSTAAVLDAGGFVPVHEDELEQWPGKFRCHMERTQTQWVGDCLMEATASAVFVERTPALPAPTVPRLEVAFDGALKEVLSRHNFDEKTTPDVQRARLAEALTYAMHDENVVVTICTMKSYDIKRVSLSTIVKAVGAVVAAAGSIVVMAPFFIVVGGFAFVVCVGFPVAFLMTITGH